MKLKTLVLSGVLLASPFCGAALAQSTGFYAGADYVLGDYSVDDRPIRNQSAIVGSVDDMSAGGFRAKAGWQLNEIWGLELGYYDAGEFVVRGTGAPSIGGTYSARGTRTAWTLGATYTIPLGTAGKWALRGTAGFEQWSMEWTTRGNISPIADDDAHDAFAGAEIRYNVNARLSGGVGLDHHWGGNGQSVNLYSIGGTVKF